MKRAIFLMLLVCFPVLAQQDTSSVKNYTIEEFYGNTRIAGGEFSNDETKLLMSSDESGIFNVYEINISDGTKTQVTNSTEDSFFAEDYVPGTGEIIYSADKGGNEISHLYLLQKNGEAKELTPAENEKANFGGWSDDDQYLYYISNKRDPKFFDIYKMDKDTWEPEMLYENDEGYQLEGLSHNENLVALSQPITTSESKLFIYDREKDKMTEISREKGNYSASGFSKNDQKFYYITDVGKEYAYLVEYDLESGESSTVYETNWDVMYSYLSENDKYRVIAINEDGKNRLIVQNNETGEKVDLPEVPDGDIKAVNISDSENLMRLTIGTSKTPNNLYVYNFRTNKIKKLTNTLNSKIDPEDLVASEVVRYESFDGLEIPAIYYKPQQASENNKVPALVWVHGGPGGQSRIGYSALIQYLVNHGYAVLAVNNRGSSGYGKSFYKMDDKKHGEEDLKDVIWGKKWLQEQDYIDDENIGIIGGSYGGYMTMAAMTFNPEEFDVGVNLFGVTNWLRTLKSIPPYWEAYKKALYDEMGDPTTKDSIALYNKSPLFHADKVKNPVMVLQGANDPRVLQVESDEIVEELKKNNVPVEYVVFEDEGHGFIKKENEIKGYKQILAFLDKYLKDEEM
ncbi:Dipeptidyl aminopeptidase/acylaminoacyl peptidase [Salinimicrobium catena]|uniref:Dipeptidyl aminopeptidase/acylaminoacyl peptidase n=1 Tax=Salinimicrobium catena TaxID=390640 RepID=A0A1H5NWE6_9FLAO|nr:S9 family peptidase [Salinimicrobium catena]SDL58753.1 Dipeptidyl aminopeptidase/acylaminoacyl peptidase [Salinimicrobium catena]SEF05989.1 Dipeptidyl aminopeptidase/acylaminoacyl peptidase [Salinimicrobium catena]